MPKEITDNKISHKDFTITVNKEQKVPRTKRNY